MPVIFDILDIWNAAPDFLRALSKTHSAFCVIVKLLMGTPLFRICNIIYILCL